MPRLAASASAVLLSLGGAFAASEVRFLVVGDFGEHGKADQTPVAVSMGRVAESFGPDWVLSTGCVLACSLCGGLVHATNYSTGVHPPAPTAHASRRSDNVYDKGITGVDDPLWKANFQVCLRCASRGTNCVLV